MLNYIHISHENFAKYFYLAVPLVKGQLSCREIFDGEQIMIGLKKNQPLMISDVNGVFAENSAFRKKIMNRGL